ncbi:MAG: aminoacyl-tRNA hydrolase [Candidatus Pacebacteria bacterium]|nr:aminoacyl-tRNA hydrolase [Candidatus Paceibacterota bacterium]MBP9842405.1 aminoacyl-tRNA hydrolase [Candidatus Paceibacterota bacterium]
MYYIVGLGNHGEKYQNTRHNVGWLVCDYVREKGGLPSLASDNSMSGRVTEGKIGGVDVRVLYPDTFMNHSGSAVAKFVPRAEVGSLIVIHDDIDLPLGEIKLGKGRGDGGNNGVKSIIEKLGTKDFIRIRIGIAPRSFWTGEVKRPAGGGPLERFVLKPFTRSEGERLGEVKERALGALQELLQKGLETAMNKYN